VPKGLRVASALPIFGSAEGHVQPVPDRFCSCMEALERRSCIPASQLTSDRIEMQRAEVEVHPAYPSRGSQ